MYQQSQGSNRSQRLERDFTENLERARYAISIGQLTRAHDLFKKLLVLQHELPQHRRELVALQDRLLQAADALIESELGRAETCVAHQEFVQAGEVLAQTWEVIRQLAELPFETPRRSVFLEQTKRVELMRADLADRTTRTRSFELVIDTNNDVRRQPILTPEFLVEEVAPFLNALAKIQEIADWFGNRPRSYVRIRVLTQSSPISVSLDGAADAVDVIQDIVVPWKREHAKTLAQLQEQEKIVQIEKLKAEVLETRASAHRERSEANRIDAETDPRLTQAQLDRLMLENERLRLEIEERKIGLVLTVVEKLSPNLDQDERRLLGFQLLRPLGVITESPLLMAPPSVSS